LTNVFSTLAATNIFAIEQRYDFGIDDLHVIGQNDTAAVYSKYYDFIRDEVSLFTYTVLEKFLGDLSTTEIAYCTFVCVGDCFHFYWQGQLVLKLFPPAFKDNDLLIQFARVYDGDLCTEH